LQRIWGFGGGFDRFLPWATAADFVPRITVFCAGFAPGTDRNLRSRAGLVLQSMRRFLYRAVTRTGAWKKEVHVMLSWVVTFLIIALIAGILGFGGIAGASIEIAKVIFFIAVILFLISAVVGLARGRTRV
jgi:uncharacterized membrane protein YtjA (UPF0391 family)